MMLKQPIDLEVVHDEFKRFHKDHMTLVMATVDEQGVPNASYAPYVEVEGRFYIYVSELAAHTRNLLDRSDVSVFFVENESLANHPFGRRRVTYQCKAHEIVRESEQFASTMPRFAEKFGSLIDKTLFHLNDFHLFGLQPVDAVYVQGFARAFEISGPRLHDIRHINDAGHQTSNASARHQLTDPASAGAG